MDCGRLMPLLLLLVVYAPWASLAATGFLQYDEFRGKPYDVKFDNRSFLLNGKRSLFVAGSLHYPRIPEGMWDFAMRRAKEDGLNLIQMYTFWNYHEYERGMFNWSGNANFTKFIETAAKHGLFVNLRIGPYVVAEWNHGGLPWWLNEIPGMKLRASNAPFMTEMERYVREIVHRARHLFADRGGPIIMSQIENELQTTDHKFVDWCGWLAENVTVNVPWLMCNGETAKNTINSCNAGDCTSFIEKNGQSGRIQVDQPAVWTENEGWYQCWGEHYPDYGDVSGGALFPSRRPTEHAYATARWYARGGSYMCYYMHQPGNNYGIFAGGAVTTMFTDLVQYHSDFMPNEPKLSHLHRLNGVLQSHAEAIIFDASQMNNRTHLPWWNGKDFVSGSRQYAFVYRGHGGFLAFVENDDSVVVLTKFQNKELWLSANSIVLLDASLTVLFNSSALPAVTRVRKYSPVVPRPLEWTMWRERLDVPLQPMADKTVIEAHSPWGQLEQTKGLTEYFLYETNISFNFQDCNCQLGGHIGNAYTFFVDGNFSGEVSDRTHFHGPSYPSLQIRNPKGLHRLTVYSETLGIDNTIVPDLPIAIAYGLNTLICCGQIVTNYKWHMRTHMDGELLKVYTPEGAASVSWSAAPGPKVEGGTWLRTSFPTPSLNEEEQLVFDCLGMGRGHAFVNGHDIGRYWSFIGKAMTEPTQRYYHIPKDWLNPAGKDNLFVLGEVVGASDTSKAGVYVVHMVTV